VLARLAAVLEGPVFVAILKDAWRQYRRRPVAVLLAVALALVKVPIAQSGDALQIGLLAPLLVATLLLELFLVAYLAGALAPEPPPAAEAFQAARRSFLPGVRAYLLKVLYAIPAFFIGILLLGPRDTGPLSAGDQAKFFIGLAPLFAFAWAFLAVLNQRVVLDRERRVTRAAASSHRVAAANFPICLLIALVEALSMVVAGLPSGLARLASVMFLLALLEPFRIAMGNALFQRTRALQALEPQARQRDRNRSP
jgi:hypothetical protein